MAHSAELSEQFGFLEDAHAAELQQTAGHSRQPTSSLKHSVGFPMDLEDSLQRAPKEKRLKSLIKKNERNFQKLKNFGKSM